MIVARRVPLIVVARRVPILDEPLAASLERWDPFDPSSRREWRQHAERLYRKWRLPPSVSADDVEQELLMSAWHFHERWDPSRGIPHRKWVFTGAINRAKSWIHAQRGALRRSCRAPSRTPVTFDHSDPSHLDARIAEEGLQERVTAVSERVALITAAVATVGGYREVREAECAAAVALCDFDAAVEHMLRADVRRRCRIESESQARALLRRFARSMASDLAL